MFFNSAAYLIFLVFSVATYWLLPYRWRIWWVLLASLFFYAFWRIEFVLLIALSAYIDYHFSLKIYEASDNARRKYLLITSLSTNLGLLIYFKYAYFLANNITMLGNIFGQDWQINLGRIILPLGISFYTFVSIGYTIDVYRRLMDPVRNYGVYLTYVMFWPHMIAGPILRGHELIIQLTRRYRFTLENTISGIRLILAGLFLKVVLADLIAPFVDSEFATNPSYLSGVDVWTMAFSFGFQIYFDFAGYSLIAIGSARLLGIHFPDNFNWPYLAISPRDFWKRWHITLSSWVRDYLYLPMSGERFRDRSDGGIDIQVHNTKASKIQLALPLFLTWFIMGLWHGANWRFALWGLWHASLIFMYRLLKDRFDRIPHKLQPMLGWGITIPLIMLGWIPFRAESTRQTYHLFGQILQFSNYRNMAFPGIYYMVVIVVAVGMIAFYFVHGHQQVLFKKVVIRQIAEGFALCIMLIVITLIFIYMGQSSQFIYFQF